MARIRSLIACEMAFLDRQDRLCLIGITTHLPVPSLPLAVNQLMLVAQLSELQQVEEFGVNVEVIMPNGMFSNPREPECISIEMAGPFVLVTLRNVPLAQEGVYRFEVGLTGQEPSVVTIPVLLASAPEPTVGVH